MWMAPHLGAMGKDPWGENGIGRFMRVLAANGYLPLVAPDLAPDAAESGGDVDFHRAGLRLRSDEEIAAVTGFVKQGGFFLSMVGSPDAEPSRPLLDQLGLHVDSAPLPPWVGRPEAEPLGRYWYPSKEQPFAQFYAAWPVYSTPNEATWPTGDSAEKTVIAGHRMERGQAFILGDSAFVLKKNFGPFSPNPNFWRSQLQNWLGHAGEKTPTVEPTEGGIIDLPKPKADEGAPP